MLLLRRRASAPLPASVPRRCAPDAAAVPRVCSTLTEPFSVQAAALRSCARLAATRRSVVMRSAATDEIIEKMKTLTVRGTANLQAPAQGFACGPRENTGGAEYSLLSAIWRLGCHLHQFSFARPASYSVGSCTALAHPCSLPYPQLLEAAELVKQIETTFGVDASAPAGGMMMAAGPAAAAEEVEVQTEFNLSILDCAADKRIAAIKVVRSLTSLGLKEAKDAVTTVPFLLLEAKSKADVDKAKAELEAAGCKCEIK